MSILADVLVIGGGSCAREIGRRLQAAGVTVCRVAPAPDVPAPEEITESDASQLSATEVVGCSGFAGNFETVLAWRGEKEKRHFGAIVVALDPAVSPNHALYDLSPGPTTMSISRFEARWNARQQVRGWPSDAKIVFLNGIEAESHPCMSARMLRSCRALQEQGGVHTFYLTGNLKVADDALEEECHAAKTAGTVFYKFNGRPPLFEALPTGKTRVTGWDESLRRPIDLTVDGVVVDETLAPSRQLARLAEVLRLETGPEGFLQGANVHRLSNATNRRGIFVADAARGVLGPDELAGEAERVVSAVSQLLQETTRPVLPAVVIDPLRCSKCLTCYRVCPYGAIKIAEFMTVIPEACQRCGLCAAWCPGRAIDVVNDSVEARQAWLGEPVSEGQKSAPVAPRVVVFGCERSAAQARRLALQNGYALPDNLVFIDGVCGGSFSSRHLMAAIDQGADGVMLLTCHKGNCHAGHGGDDARRGAAVALTALEEVGFEPQRLYWGTLSANMGGEFATLVNVFYDNLKKLGPFGG